MINHSLPSLLFIRACIVLLQYTPIIEGLLALALLLTHTGLQYYSPTTTPPPILTKLGYGIAVLIASEFTYYLTLYLPHKRRLLRQAEHPTPLTPAERAALFEQCAANVPDWEHYLRVWFLGAPMAEIKRDNAREFLLVKSGAEEAEAEALEAEVETYLSRIESRLGYKLAPGRGAAESFRLTLDAVHIRYRSIVWYAVIGIVDVATHVRLVYHGLAYFGPSLQSTLAVFPPRLQAVPFLSGHRHSSASSEIGYWFRPHTSRTRLPVVFVHGIGVGLWPYTNMLAELAAPAKDDEGDQIGIIAIEVLAISNRLTAPPLSQPEFIAHVRAILAQQGQAWAEFVLVSHSYGSVLTTHILRSPELGPRVRAVVLIDPVSVLLHMPDVAYNFTRRPPQDANEWQLWYFASMDMGVAECLGRHFFWRENIIWQEELTRKVEGGKKRKVAVCLSGRDLIVNTQAVARYLVSGGELKDAADKGQSELRDAFGSKPGDEPSTHKSHSTPGLEVLWFPNLDHAQAFDTRRDRDRVVNVIRRFCLDKSVAAI
ncbi:hypothetical protein B0T17DRAFT_490645 [Bombardia bombarda]|uniref:AB hydrolase-1 domain-containing protein n=1 Tax=Bombardia bombarda TaxID=252184 RepID=A0AA39XAP1_9PEZI|nr:hypothetical protein B0T17DRAFT_490645 [Bombardia bombarda]